MMWCTHVLHRIIKSKPHERNQYEGISCMALHLMCYSRSVCHAVHFRSLHSLIISMLSGFHRHGSSLVNFIFNLIHVSRSFESSQNPVSSLNEWEGDRERRSRGENMNSRISDTQPQRSFNRAETKNLTENLLLSLSEIGCSWAFVHPFLLLFHCFLLHSTLVWFHSLSLSLSLFHYHFRFVRRVMRIITRH